MIPTIRAVHRAAPPNWALGQRLLIDKMNEAGVIEQKQDSFVAGRVT